MASQVRSWEPGHSAFADAAVSSSIVPTEQGVTDRAAQYATRPAGGTRPLILIVDDDRVTVRLLEHLLRGAGFATESAGDLYTAAQRIAAQRFALILLDVHLPDGNGLEFCERLSHDRTGFDTPILFISTNTDEPTKVKGFGAGAVDYITKPLAAGEVLARVRTHLRLRRAYEELAVLHAERIQQIASTQQSLMPVPEQMPEARFGVCLRQMHGAGGDFYDVLHAGEHTTDYVVADASGHSLAVSLWTASFKALLAEYATVLNTPGEVFQLVNRTLIRVLPEAAYFTGIFVRVNRRTNTLTLVNAGHPPAIHLESRTGVAVTIAQEGDVIGMFNDAQFGTNEIRVARGDRIFLCTDGSIEMNGSRVEGQARLMQVAINTQSLDLQQAISTMAEQLCIEDNQEDDAILFGIEV